MNEPIWICRCMKGVTRTRPFFNTINPARSAFSKAFIPAAESATSVAVAQAVLQLGAAVGLLLLVARLFQAKYILSGVPFSMKRYFAVLTGRA
jgi:hypothetical protein